MTMKHCLPAEREREVCRDWDHWTGLTLRSAGVEPPADVDRLVVETDAQVLDVSDDRVRLVPGLVHLLDTVPRQESERLSPGVSFSHMLADTSGPSSFSSALSFAPSALL